MEVLAITVTLLLISVVQGEAIRLPLKEGESIPLVDTRTCLIITVTTFAIWHSAVQRTLLPNFAISKNINANFF